MQIRVYYEDTDISGAVYHSNYFKFCERARSELFFQQGFSPINGNSHFVVRQIIQADFFKSAKFGDILNITTALLEFRGASIKIEQKIFKQDELIFLTQILLAHLKADRVAKIDDQIKDIFK